MMRFKGAGTLWSPHHPGGDSVRYDPGVDVQIYGYLEGYSSIANVVRCWVRELAGVSQALGVHNYAPESATLDGLPEGIRRINPYAPLAIYHGLPARLPPMLCTNHEITIGAFVCETDRIPDHWTEAANRFDLVIVPSKFCQQAYIRSGVTVPVIVVPHGVEAEYRPYALRRRDDRFVFYNTFSASSFPVRKGCEELIRCFTRAFAGRDDVVLRLRTHDAGEVRKWRRRYDRTGLVQMMPYRACSTAEYAGLFSRADCTVHPSKGEGFGLVPLQSIACETPVIAMPVSGMADYLNEDNALLLRSTGRVDGRGWGGQSGNYFGVDEDHLIELLRRCRDNPEREKSRVSWAAPALRRQYAWSSVLAPLVGIVTELLGAQDTARARARLLERLRDTGMDGRAGRSLASRRSPGAKRRSRQSMDALFRHTFCITTERYRHRWPAVEAQWRAHGIKGEFFQGVDLTRVTFPATVKPDGQPMTPHAQAIIHNHLAVVRRARDENFPQVAVFEDDFVFSDAFSHFSDYLAFVPDNWDVLMLGGNWRIRDPDPVNERVVRVRRSWNAHGYIIRRRFYDTFLEFQKPMQWETDVYNGQMQDKSLGNWYGFYKDMCWQRGLDGGSVTMSILHPGQLDNFRRLLSEREVGYRFWWRHGGHLVDDYMSAFGSYQIDDSVPDHMSTIQ